VSEHEPEPDVRGADPQSAANLAAAVLEEELRRTEASVVPEALLADAELPGVDDAELSLRDALREGGRRTIVIVGLLSALQLMDNGVFNVLAPDIQKSLDISDTVLGAIGGATGVLFVLGAIPMSSLADRMSRKTLLAVVMSIWAGVIALTGAVQNALQMFVARLGAGVGQAGQLPVSAPLLVDAYPIAARSRVFAVLGGAQAVGTMAAPFLAGGIAALAGDDAGWRWAFLLLGLIALPIAASASSIREPRRGRHEMRSVLGEELPPEEEELPISLSVAFERLRKIQSFYYFLVGMAALGFALFTAPLFLNLYFDEELGLDAFERGVIATIVAVPTLLAIAVAGRRADALFRRSPPAAMAFIGLLVALFGGGLVVAIWMPNIWSVVPILAVSTACARAAFTILPAVVSTIIPYRLRARGTAMIGIYIFLFGSFFGAVLTGILSDAYGTRAALTIIVLPSTLVGGALIALGARHIRQDMAMVVEELREEQAERTRMQQPDALVPVLQVRNLDFSYGKVQVLFDVNLDVHAGETLALLGTNGAGKSTLLRVISGLGVATRGVIRLHGRTVTYADPELRVKIGIVQLIGGGATFPPLTVRENLRTAAFLYPRKEQARRMEQAIALFPALRERYDTPASELSGGQQQMLALAMTMVHQPEILIIDELSLGLAPVVVQQMLEVVQRLRDAGTTMVIVEQSLNVALAVADRAIFMEKGQVRFEGSAAELAARDDLARAVFLGS
jgi:ABC-type branched-subunit amino acid transport system ATPase component/predicted MFS family arabinose efflux permease